MADLAIFNATMNNATTSEFPLANRVIEATLLTLICIAALVGNISLFIVITTSKHLFTTSNSLVLCLSTADILVSAVNMPVVIYTIVNGDWGFGDAACVVMGFFTMLTFIASVMSLGTISINRFIMICYPSKYRTIYTQRNAVLFIAGTWLLSLALASPPLFGWGSYGYLPNQSFCFCDWKTSKSYTVFMVLACFGGPCSVMSFSYIRILKEVRASKRRIASNTKANRSSSLAEDNSSQIDDQSVLSNPTDDTASGKRRKRSLPKLQVSFKSQKKSQSEQTDKNGNGLGAPVTSSSNQFLAVPGQRSTAEIQAKRREKRKRQRQEELRLTLSLLVVIVVFIVCWLPFCITMFLSVFSPSPNPVPRMADIATLILGFANSCCNPIIYGLMNKKFKEGFKRLFRCCAKTPPDVSSSLERQSSASRSAQ